MHTHTKKYQVWGTWLAVVFGRRKTILLIKLENCTESYFKHTVGEEVAMSLSCISLLPPCPVWIRTPLKKLSLGHGFICSKPLELPEGTNHLVLIDLRCHLILEFGGNKTLWLCLTWQELVNLSLLAIVFSSNLNCTLLKHPAKINMHEQGIKPQSPTWQARILPLNH